MTLLKAAYLQNPYDAKIAARIGFLHAWSLTERQSLKNIPPQITDSNSGKKVLLRSGSTQS